MKNTLIEYVRVARGSRKGQPRGVVVANGDGIGWSYVNTKAGDTFDKELGIKIALDRAAFSTKKKMPHDVKSVVKRMELRAAKYFKPATV